MGYHKQIIKKGILGEFSKIEEEFQELTDSVQQDAKILTLCELADLCGAIDLFVKKQFNLTIEDLVKMSKLTQSAFENGER